MSDSEALPRVVVDTNLVVSSFLSRTGAPRSVIQALHDGRFVLVITALILKEYTDVLQRPIFASKYGIDHSSVTGFLRFVHVHAITLINVDPAPVVVRDELDQKFLDAALTANVDFLVSGDNDLLALGGDPRLGSLRIVKARSFLEAIAPT